MNDLAAHDRVEIRSSPIHGTGGFARCFIAQGTRVIEYVGDIIDKTESLRRCEQNNEYIFHLNDQTDIDGNVSWNPARFLNHSCHPNCEAEYQTDHIWIVALREIAAGEEVTFNYGYDFSDYQEHPCHCGSPQCVGYIVAEEYFPTLRAKAKAGDQKSTEAPPEPLPQPN